MSKQMIATIQGSSASQQLLLREIQAIKGTQTVFFNNVQSQLDKMSKDTNIANIKNTIGKINSNVSEILDIESSTASIHQEQLDETKKYSEVLRTEVDEIETKMTETNQLLTAKFDEFSELLQKSNTEALVEVMKKVTEEF